MDRYEKTLLALLRGGSDANLRFEDLRALLIRLGFEERIRGSHHHFHRAGIAARINLQRAGHEAKAYQVRQVRAIIVRYRLGEV